MRFLVADADTAKGSGLANEDLVGSTSHMAWIIDGATALDPPVLGTDSDALWYAEAINSTLLSVTTTPRSENEMKALFSHLADTTSDLLTKAEFPKGRTPPVCSIAICSVNGDSLILGFVGDICTIVSDPAFPVVLAKDDRFSAREKRASKALVGRSSPERIAEARDGMRLRREQYIHGVNDMYVFSPVLPSSAVNTRQFSIGSETQVVMVTDGVTRGHESYGLWRDELEMFELIKSDGLSGVIRIIRDFEQSMSTNGSRIKQSDDATGILLEFQT